MKIRPFKSFFYFGLIIISLLSVYIGLNRAVFDKNRSQDFQWSCAKLLVEKQNPYDKYIKWQKGKIEQPFLLGQHPNYPASALIFLLPYTIFEWKTAKILWAVSNIIFTILIIIGLQKLFPIKRLDFLILAIVLFVAGSSWRTHIGCGQHGLFVLAGFIWAVILSKKNKIIAGFFVSLSWLKYTISFPLTLFFFNKRNYKIILTAVFVHLGLTVFISLWIGQPFFDLFFGSVKVALIATGNGVVDILGVVKKYNLPVTVIPLILFLFLILTLKIIGTKQKDKNELLFIIFLSFMSMALFFHNAYDFIVLIFPLWYLLASKPSNRYFKFFLISLITLQWFLVPMIDFFKKYFGEQVINLSYELLNVLTIFIFYTLIFITAEMIGNSNLITYKENVVELK